MITVHERFYATQYDGANGAAVAAELGSTVTFDNGSTLVTAGVEINVTNWVVWQINNAGAVVIHEVITDATLTEQYQVEPAAPELLVGIGNGAVAAMAGGGNQNIDVNIAPAMPDAAYKPVATLRGAPGVLGGHGITGVAVLDEDTVRVTVASAIGSLNGASVHVYAAALA